MVWPSICLVTSQSMSISSTRASPFFMRVMMSYSHGAPSLYQAINAIDIMCQHAKSACSAGGVRTLRRTLERSNVMNKALDAAQMTCMADA